MTKTAEASSETKAAGFHVIFGSGGSKAILGGAGAIVAFEIAGLKDWLSVGGVSGGAFPASFLASGQPCRQLLRTVLNTNFSTLLKPKTNLIVRLLALMMKYRYEITRPERGVFSPAPLARFVEQQIGTWPKKMWTVASGKCGIYVFTDQGVFREHKGVTRKVSDITPTTALAVSATCAVPGFIDGVRYAGSVLHDGALGPDGATPVAIPVRYFGATAGSVIAFDIPEEAIKSKRWLRLLWSIGCFGSCPTSFQGEHPLKEDGFLVIQPQITGFHGLQFDLTLEQKWLGVVAGMTATLEALSQYGLIPDANKQSCLEWRQTIDELRLRGGANFTIQIEQLLVNRGLLAPAGGK